MRVLHLINDSSISRGGAQRVLDCLCDINRDAGHDVDIGVINNSGDQKNVFFLGRNTFFKTIFLILKNRYDFVIVHSRCFYFVFLTRLISNSKIIFYCHANYQNLHYLTSFFRPNIYIAVSNSVRLMLLNAVRVTCPIFVIENPLIQSSVPVRRFNFTDNVALTYVGSLNHWKGCLIFASYVSLLPQDRKYEINFFGDGPEIDNVKDVLENYHGAVNFYGFVNNPFSSVGSGDIIVIPSFTEGFGLVAIEAIVSCHCIVYSKIPALCELLEADPFSFGFDLNSFESFLNAVDLAAKACADLKEEILLERSKNIMDKYSISLFRYRYLGLLS